LLLAWLAHAFRGHSFFLYLRSFALENRGVPLELWQLAANSQIPIPFPSFSSTGSHSATVTEDCWLEHGEASKCLGISKSTLYRYVSQQRIECRKVAGRLEYRQSTLERLKKDRVRPARRSHHAGGIIPPAFSSGK
jgi:hypothetical protein